MTQNVQASADAGTLGVAELAQTNGQAATDDCPNGGIEVVFGVDVNANGELDAEEITRREAVCNGADGSSCSLSNNEDNTYELSCPDAEPITVRNGADGAPGMDGAAGRNSVFRESTEAPGNNCENGGLKIEAGFDDNGDGTR